MITIQRQRKFSYRLLAFLWITGLMASVTANAQGIQRSNVPAPAFEVTGSIYPWDIHDEGIDLVLDNVTGMAGANSVFYGPKLLTTPNPKADSDRALFAKLGLTPMPSR